MSFKTNLLVALTLAAGSAMAADVPSQAKFPQTEQLKAMSVQHWSVIADDLAKSTLAELGARAKAGVYIADASDSHFDEALHTFLVDSFHKAGAKVLATPRKDAIIVDVNSVVTDKPGTRTELTVTVSVTGADDAYLARKSNVYYIEKSDSRLFHSVGKTLHIKGGN